MDNTQPDQRLKPNLKVHEKVYAETAIISGESMDTMKLKGMAFHSPLFLTEAELQVMEEEEHKPVTAANYKPVHGGYPSVSPSNPVPGSEWDDSSKLPDTYFDAVKLSYALNEIAHDAQARAWSLQSALRNVRLQIVGAEEVLAKLYIDYIAQADVELRVRMIVNELANTIEGDRERPQPTSVVPGVTVYPSMYRYYTLRPVWRAITQILSVFKRTNK